jgi:hypothetical protein
MATGNDVINGAMRLIGVLASGETPSSSESNDALTSLNNMIDSWTNQSLLIYEKAYETFALVANQQSYQWGSGVADFNSARPQKLENVNWQQVSSTTTVELPVEILNKDQWAAISVKGLTSNLPTRCWLDMTYPNATLYIWPIPSVAGNIVCWSWKPLITISTLTTAISLPPGYLKALIYNLAMELAPEYGKQVSSLVESQAVNSKAVIKRMNSKILLMGCDTAVLNKRSTWNWYTGE